MNYINTDTDAYPVTRADIETALPNVLWGEDNPPEPYRPVLPALSPPTPAAGEMLVEGDPELVGDDWRQTWTVEDATPLRILTRLQYTQALNHFGGLATVLTAVALLDPTDPVRLYFDQTANFNRDDARYLVMEAALDPGGSGTDAVFEYGSTLHP